MRSSNCRVIRIASLEKTRFSEIIADNGLIEKMRKNMMLTVDRIAKLAFRRTYESKVGRLDTLRGYIC